MQQGAGRVFHARGLPRYPSAWYNEVKERIMRTHCKSGKHEWTEENTHVGRDGKRRCLMCKYYADKVKREARKVRERDEREAKREQNIQWIKDNPDKLREIADIFDSLRLHD